MKALWDFLMVEYDYNAKFRKDFKDYMKEIEQGGKMINTFEEVKKILRSKIEWNSTHILPDNVEELASLIRQLTEPKPEEEEELQKDIGNIIAEYSCNPEDYSLVNTVKEIMAKIKGEK